MNIAVTTGVASCRPRATPSAHGCKGLKLTAAESSWPIEVSAHDAGRASERAAEIRNRTKSRCAPSQAGRRRAHARRRPPTPRNRLAPRPEHAKVTRSVRPMTAPIRTLSPATRRCASRELAAAGRHSACSAASRLNRRTFRARSRRGSPYCASQVLRRRSGEHAMLPGMRDRALHTCRVGVVSSPRSPDRSVSPAARTLRARSDCGAG